MDGINVICRARDNSYVGDFIVYYIVSVELTNGDWIITYKFNPDDVTTMTATRSEADYVVYIVPKYEYVD